MTSRPKPRMISMREFRDKFHTLTEPVKVVRARGEIEIIGTWTPEHKNGRDPVEPSGT